MGFGAPEPLTAEHRLDDFDCGQPSLHEWLQKRALANQRTGASRTFVVCDDAGVAGYYCLSAGAVARDLVPRRLKQNMPELIPVILLGRLACDLRTRGMGLGGLLVRDALLRVLNVADAAVVAAVVVHALNESARGFWKAWDFRESPLQPSTLVLPLATIREAFESD